MVKKELDIELQNLRENMPKGYRNLLAKEHHVNVHFIDMVFRGQRTNMDIIESAVKMAEKYKQEMITLTERIKIVRMLD